MRLKVINTGSIGNAYILDSGREQLLIECGVRFTEIKQALQFDLSNVVGCLVTHEHLDHARSVKDVVYSGIKVICSQGTANSIGLESNSVKIVKPLTKYKVGEFTIMPFDVQHDVAEPFGFLINHPDTGLILFATDTYNLKYDFPNIEIAIIEANYDQALIDEKKQNDTLHFGDYRVIKSHMSVQNCARYLNKIDTNKLRGVYLIHLSERNGNHSFFENYIKEATGCIAAATKKGNEFEIGKTANF